MAARRGACVLGVLLAVTLFLAVPSARAADPAPAFNLTDIDGVPLNSTGLLGHVVIFDFGGTWCEPCKIVEAAFKEEFATFEARGVVFITTFIAPLNAPSDIRTYQTSHAIPWHLVQDNGVSTTYGIVQIPHFFVIDKKGYAVLDWAPVPGFTAGDVKRALEPVLTAALAIGPAPPWTLTDLDGRNVSSGQFRGRIVVLDFANTSCGTVPIAMPARNAPKTTLTLRRAAAATNKKQRKRANLEWDISIKTRAFDVLSQRRTRGRTTNPETRNTVVSAIVRVIVEVEGAEAPATPVAIASPA